MYNSDGLSFTVRVGLNELKLGCYTNYKAQIIQYFFKAIHKILGINFN